MVSNPEPNKQAVELLFSHRFKTVYHTLIFFNGIEVNKATEHKHFGLIHGPKLTFFPHVNEKITKAQKSLGILKFLSSYLPLKTLDQLYKLFIRSQFEYCCVNYQTPPTTNPCDSSVKLHPLIRYHAGRIITAT